MASGSLTSRRAREAEGAPEEFSESKINVLKKSQKSWLFSVHQQIVFTKKI